MTAEELIKSVEGDSMARLRWLVLKEFGVLPGSKRAGELSDRDCLLCAAQMVIDRRERQGERAEQGENPGFDEGRFCKMGGRG